MPFEVLAVWALFGVVAVAILVTYARVPASDLYHVSGSGLSGALSRVVVFLNFPLALVAIPILATLAERLATRAATIAACLGIALSAAVFWPGVVDEADLDARPVNAIAALGVLVAAALTAVAVRTLGRPARPARQRGDWARIVIAGVAMLLAIPWLAAELGFYLDGVPVLGAVYETGALRTQPGIPTPHPAVHHGHHHGMDGVLLVVSALLLSRMLPSIHRWSVRAGVAGCLALMFCYGVGNVANDFWLEQIVKRKWTNWEIPDVTTPSAGVAWGVIVLSAAALWAIWFRRDRGPQSPTLAATEAV
jgi:hypothetical protein